MALQLGNTVQAWSPRGAFRPQDATAALLDLAGPVEGLHVLVIGPGALEAMCALNERGAAAVVTLRADRWVRPETVDLALVPNVIARDAVRLAVRHARRSIRPPNSLVLRFMPDASASLVWYARKCMVEQGFRVRRPQQAGTRTVLTGDLPLAGRPNG